MALIAPAFVGAIGLSVETGYWHYLQDRAQAAADLSAYAGGVSLRNGDGNDRAIEDATSEAGKLGYSSFDATVTVNAPIVSGPYAGSSGVEVEITYSPPRFFSGLFSSAPITHSVRAAFRTLAGSDACILALNPNADRALYLTGSAGLTLEGCSLMSNSVSDSAFYLTGSADVDVDCINAAGGAELSGGGYSLVSDCGSPRSNQPIAEDPYASVPEPNPENYDCEDLDDVSTTSGGVTTVSPGSDGVVRFCDGLTLKDDIAFEPGLYIVDDGSFKINSNADISGDGVTWFMTDGAEAQWNGNADIQFSAPTSGDYKGIVFMGDRSDSGALHKFNGTADSELTGAIYTAASDVEFLGDFSGAGGCLQIVADEIKISGSTEISHSCDHVGINWASLAGSLELVE